MRWWITMAMTAAMLAGWRPAAAEDFSGNDLRDLRIGLAVTALPASGYVGFACADDVLPAPTGCERCDSAMIPQPATTAPSWLVIRRSSQR
jgi:hypothetical protein